MYQYPVNNGGIWSKKTAKDKISLFLSGKSTEHGSHGKTLIYVEGVNTVGGDGHIDHEVDTFE